METGKRLQSLGRPRKKEKVVLSPEMKYVTAARTFLASATQPLISCHRLSLLKNLATGIVLLRLAW
jgi:hypothetical protein